MGAPWRRAAEAEPGRELTTRALASACRRGRPAPRIRTATTAGCRDLRRSRSPHCGHSPADRPAGMRGSPTEINVREAGSVRGVFVERPKHAELVLAHLAVVPIAVLHRGHNTLDVNGAGDIPTDDGLRLQSAGQVGAPPVEHHAGVILLDLLPASGPPLPEGIRRDLFAKACFLPWGTERRLEDRRVHGEQTRLPRRNAEPAVARIVIQDVERLADRDREASLDSRLGVGRLPAPGASSAR